MSDPAIVQRAARAKQAVEYELQKQGFEVIRSDNRRICLVALKQNEMRVIKICLDKLTPTDTSILGSIPAPVNCSRELWVRKKGVYQFSVHKI